MHRLRTCAFVALVIAIAGSGFGSEWSINGELWKELGTSRDGEARKVGIVRGFLYGFDTAALFLKKAAKADQSLQVARGGSTQAPPYGIDEFIKALDRFYSDPKNSKVELDDAMKILSEKVLIKRLEQGPKAITAVQEKGNGKLR